MTNAEDCALYRQRHPGRRRESAHKWWVAHPEKAKAYFAKWKAANPEKVFAHDAVNNAIRDGRLSRDPCEVCGTTECIEGHHPDYMKPLDVHWLCREHHGLCHRGVEAP